MPEYTTLDQFLEQEGIAKEVHANTAKRLAELEAKDDPITLGSASFVRLPFWRSTRHDPPEPGVRVFARYWVNGGWHMQACFMSDHVLRFPAVYPSWAPFPDADDETRPEDWD